MTFYQTQIVVKDNKYYLNNQGTYLTEYQTSKFGNQHYVYMDSEYILIYGSYKGIIHVFKVLPNEVIENKIKADHNIQVPILFRLKNTIYMFFGKVKNGDNIANNMYTINLSVKAPTLKGFKDRKYFTARLGSAICQFDENSVIIISGYQEIERSTTLSDLILFDGSTFQKIEYKGPQVIAIFSQAFCCANKIIVVGGFNHLFKRNTQCYVIDFQMHVQSKSYEISTLTQEQLNDAFYYIDRGQLMCQYGKVFDLEEIFN